MELQQMDGIISIFLRHLRKLRHLIPLGGKQLKLILAIAFLITMPLARHYSVSTQAGIIKTLVYWGIFGVILALVGLLIRLLLRFIFWKMQSRVSVLRYWILLKALIKRDISGRYARSALGWPWILLQPMFQMVVFTALRAILGLTDAGNMNYVLFLFTGILPWNFVSNAVNASAPTIFANASIIKKMPVPREIFVFSAVSTAFVDFCMGMVILILMMTYFAVPININILWLPVLILLLIGLCLALGLILAAIIPFRGDISLLLPYLIQTWFFLTPVFYSVDSLPKELVSIVSINPAVGIIGGLRNLLGAGRAPDPIALLWSAAFVVILLLIGWPFFRHMSRYFADMM